MSNTIIRVENLSKRYQLGTIGYGSLQHDLVAWWSKVRGKEDPNSQVGQTGRVDPHGEFWALRGVNFDLEEGDRLGIVGRNGAGKSTLLKLLSRITSPTSGSIKVKGRIASLLEVGTGFHPELTGRENVFLNGAILGMKRGEIQSKFDEIVAFAGVSQFIDTPVKRYSSGMYVRLAFSVAAHLDSEILIVDEVLAVGDAEFQKKCIGKMDDISRSDGRSIIFVSHQASVVSKLCNKGILLEKGGLVLSGPIEQTLAAYTVTRTDVLNGSAEWSPRPGESAQDVFFVTGIYCENALGQRVSGPYKRDEDLFLVVESEVSELDSSLSFGFSLAPLPLQEEELFSSYVTDAKPDLWPAIKLGRNRHRCRIPGGLLNEGRYSIKFRAFLHFQRWIYAEKADTPNITIELAGGFQGSPYWFEKRAGAIAPSLEWS